MICVLNISLLIYKEYRRDERNIIIWLFHHYRSFIYQRLTLKVAHWRCHVFVNTARASLMFCLCSPCDAEWIWNTKIIICFYFTYHFLVFFMCHFFWTVWMFGNNRWYLIELSGKCAVLYNGLVRRVS